MNYCSNHSQVRKYHSINKVPTFAIGALLGYCQFNLSNLFQLFQPFSQTLPTPFTITKIGSILPQVDAFEADSKALSVILDKHRDHSPGFIRGLCSRPFSFSYARSSAEFLPTIQWATGQAGIFLSFILPVYHLFQSFNPSTSHPLNPLSRFSKKHTSTYPLGNPQT